MFSFEFGLNNRLDFSLTYVTNLLKPRRPLWPGYLFIICLTDYLPTHLLTHLLFTYPPTYSPTIYLLTYLVLSSHMLTYLLPTFYLLGCLCLCFALVSFAPRCCTHNSRGMNFCLEREKESERAKHRDRERERDDDAETHREN